MIITQSILIGFTIINGTAGLQLAMLAGSLFNCVVFSTPFLIDKLPQFDAHELQFTRFLLPVSHFILMLINTMTGSTRFQFDGLKQLLSFVGMLLMCYLVLQCCQMLAVFPDPMIWLDKDIAGTFLWFQIETAVFVFTLLSNSTFMAIRSFARTKIQLHQVPEQKQVPNMDTILVIIEEANAFCAQCIPFYVNLFLYIQPNGTNSGNLIFLLKSILISNFFSLTCITLIIFVHWKKGSDTWKKYSYYGFRILILLNYVLIPIWDIVMCSIVFMLPQYTLKKDTISSWIVFYYFICVHRLIEYFFSIRRSLVLDAQIYRERALLTQGKSLEQLEQELEEIRTLNAIDGTSQGKEIQIRHCIEILMEYDVPYRERERGPGAGESRIGTSLVLSEDIYCLGFICMINDSLINDHFDVENGRFWKDKKETPPTAAAQQYVGINESIQDLIEPVDPTQQSYDLFERELVQMKKEINAKRIANLVHNKRIVIFSHVLLTFLTQSVLVAMSFYELVTNSQWYIYFSFTVRAPIMFGRFICTAILHLSMLEEITIGFDFMKFALNHPYKFQYYQFAWLSGLLYCTSVLAVEIASIGIVVAAPDTIDIIFNFISLVILAQFDDYVYTSMKNESFKKLLEEDFTKHACVVSHTTSKKCRESEQIQERDPHSDFVMYRPLKVVFSSRSRTNKVLYVVYKGMRTFYVSVFYYFLPFLTIVMSCILPVIFRKFFVPPVISYE